MKLLVIEQFAELGGAQRCLLDLLPAVIEAGWTVSVGAPSRGSSARTPLELRLDALGVRSRRYLSRRYASGRKTALDHLRFLNDARRLARWIREQIDIARPDLLYVNGPRIMPAAALAVRRRPAPPLLFHCHNHVPQQSAAWLLRRALVHASASAVSCCRHAAEPFAQAAGERLSVVLNGVPGPSQAPARPAGATIGVIGRISPEKGQREFLEAARLVFNHRPDARFVVVGNVLFDDPQAHSYKRSLHALAAGLPVDFLGWSDSIDPILDRLDLLAVPSTREPGATRVILEAYARGVPVVAFRTGGIAEILEDDETGRLLDSPSPQALAAALVDALADRERLARWSAAARQRWRREFTVERYQRQMLRAMNHVIQDADGAKR